MDCKCWNLFSWIDNFKMHYLKSICFLTFLCLITCNNSLANIGSDHVEDESSKLANNDGNQNELTANEDVKAIETGMYNRIDTPLSCVCHKYSDWIFVEFLNIT